MKKKNLEALLLDIKDLLQSYKTENNLVLYKVDKLKDQQLKTKSAHVMPSLTIYMALKVSRG